ncbi:AAA family ATPase [Polaromonas sp.]|nr:AAA family ATPase [Candidatus Saccharibacteria bacterium]
MRQKQALAVMMGGSNVFLTGAPGAGKTYVLNEFVGRAMRAGKKVAVTASTGIAATHLGGTTIHAWSGLGIRDFLTSDDEKWLEGNDKLIKRYNATDVLVIDEVSMLHGARLNMLNQTAKILRKSPAPFGGLQVILVGDLFQLPPVTRGPGLIDFVYASEAWAELNPKICYITEQHRQEGHDGLLNLLEAMRSNSLEDEHRMIVGERMGKKPPADMVLTRLYAHNVDVEGINLQHLSALTTKGKTFKMDTKGSKARIEALTKSVLAPEKLELKVGAEVMFVANNFAEGFVNGSRGTVVGFSGEKPIVELLTGRTIYVEPHSWSVNEDGKVKAEVSQLPLRLAWAITIHKSQGMSLDAAEVDLSKAFTPGMGYVALSRVRSLDGLYLQGVNRVAFTMHPEIFSFDAALRQASADIAKTVNDIDDEQLTASGEVVVEINDELFEKLKDWRLRRAKADGVAPFMIAHNTTLVALAATPPQTPGQLLGTPGFGPKKAETYGADILAITAEYAA